MSSTLESIRADADRADEMIKQLAAPAPAEEAPADEVNEQASAAPSPAPAPAPAAAQPPAADTTQDENSESYAQRWRSLQGIHNALQAKHREAEQARANLEALIAQMQSAPRAPAAPRQSHLTDKDKTEYGAEMVDFVRRVVRDEVGPLAQAVRGVASQVGGLSKLAPIVETVAAAQVSGTREAFYADLTRAVPDWQTINNDPAFHAWLLEVDPFSGLKRDTLLKDAHDTLELGRVVSIFRGFARAGASAPPAAPAAAPSAPLSARERLERQVAPGRVAGSTPPQVAQKRTWSNSDIAKFYSDKRAGVYRGKEQEAAALEQDIYAAQREGRIVLNAA